MFEGLKKKLSNVIKSFSKKEEEVEKEEEKLLEQKNEQVPEREHEQKAHERTETAEPKREERKQESKQIVKLSVSTKIRGALLKKVRLTDPEIESFLEMLKISMLESDVAYDTTDEFLRTLKTDLENSSIESRHIQGELIQKVRESLLQVVSKNATDLEIGKFVEARIAEGRLPVKILFLGPNGTGKTTTIGKIAYMLKSRGISPVLSASDTFRAAAIEQTEHHANALHVPVIKSGYGADPASVAFDAVSYAKAHRIEAVLIDSAGRQETNKNLINEIQKMDRVVKPDLTLYVGESTSGNVIANQISEFRKFVRIDGIILTKLDCDAKGGNAISISNVTGIPILLLGTGESYKDLIPYDPKMIIDAILPRDAGAG